jgi:hypothetical protein
VNIGVLICINCSGDILKPFFFVDTLIIGCHRSLGVHISKVRSLTLDNLEPEHVEVLKGMGNTVANSIWEAHSAEGYEKPNKDSSRFCVDPFSVK